MITFTRQMIAGMALAGLSVASSSTALAAEPTPTPTDHPTAKLDIAPGKFDNTWESLRQYSCPEWFQDAKFGIWAHWGPQAVPERGDWYARRMYIQGDEAYNYQVEHFGHPTKHGYKEIPPLWKAERWDPEALMARYKAAGARYFVSMGVHHDNFDLWNSTFQPRWNAVAMGPHRDVVGTWQKAAQKQGLKFGVSEHLGASFSWFATAHGSDITGPLAGVPYDGTNALDRDLYHDDGGSASRVPGEKGKWKVDPWYTLNTGWHHDWFMRIRDLVDKYQPDLLYSDGGIPFGDVGRSLVAHLYNTNMAAHGGKLEAVYNYKNMNKGQYDSSVGVPDVERGGMNDIQPFVWQTDTSNGDWFYRAKDTYKTPEQTLKLLADIVSKNGNMLLNIVLKADGSMPPESDALVNELTAWMAINGEAIHDTRPWKIYGFGPTKMEGGHFKENFAFGEEDIRFTRSKDGAVLYVIVLGVPTKPVRIPQLGSKTGLVTSTVSSVQVLGETAAPEWKQQEDALVINPSATYQSKHVVVFSVR